MSRRDWYDRRTDKRVALQIAEEQVIVADSTSYRSDLVKRIESGAITLREGQEELRKVIRDAKKNGKKTRSQIWRSA